MVSSFLDTTITAITRHPRWTLGIVLTLTAIAVFPLADLEVSTSRRALVDDDDPAQRRLIDIEHEFPGADPIVILARGESPATRRAAMDRFHEELRRSGRFANRLHYRVQMQRDEVLRLATTSSSVRFLQRHHKQIAAGQLGAVLKGAVVENRSFPGEVRSPDRKAELKLDVLALRAIDDEIRGRQTGPNRLRRALIPDNPRLDDEGYFRLDDQTHIALIYPDFAEDTVNVQRPAVEEIRRAVAQSFAPTLKVWVTGVDALEVDEREVIRAGIARSSVGAALGILLLLLIALRSLRRALLAVIPMILAIVWSYAFIALVFGTQNVVTANFTAVLMGLGIDFAIHLLARCLEAREKLSPLDATRMGWRLAFQPIVAGALTSALAFMTTTTTRFSAFAEMGWTSAFGLVAMVVLTLVTLPSLITLGNALEGASVVQPPSRLSRSMAAVLAHARWPLVALASATTMASVASVGTVEFNPHHYDFLPDSTESAEGLRILERAGGLTLGVLIPAETLAEAKTLTEKLRASPSVGRVESVSDLVSDDLSQNPLSLGSAHEPSVDQSEDTPESLGLALLGLADISRRLMRDDKERIDALRSLGRTLLSLDGAERQRYYELVENFQAGTQRISEIAKAVISGEALELPEPLRYRFQSVNGLRYALYAYPESDRTQPTLTENFVQEIREIAPGAAGGFLVLQRNSRYIIDGFRRAAVVAWILVFVAVWLVLRRFSDTFLALVPVTLGLLWLLGAMAALDLELNHANIIVLPVILGIGVDTGVHLIHRLREPRITISTLIGRTGTAVSLSAATTAVGFSALMLAEYGAMRSFGSLMLIGLTLTWLAALVVLPALIIIVRRTPAV